MEIFINIIYRIWTSNGATVFPYRYSNHHTTCNSLIWSWEWYDNAAVVVKNPLQHNTTIPDDTEIAIKYVPRFLYPVLYYSKHPPPHATISKKTISKTKLRLQFSSPHPTPTPHLPPTQHVHDCFNVYKQERDTASKFLFQNCFRCEFSRLGLHVVLDHIMRIILGKCLKLDSLNCWNCWTETNRHWSDCIRGFQDNYSSIMSFPSWSEYQNNWRIQFAKCFSRLMSLCTSKITLMLNEIWFDEVER